MSTACAASFVVGLLSALHCIGMCGGVMGALSVSLPPAIRSRPDRLAAFLLLINLGRITSFAAAGAVFGWFGGACWRVIRDPGPTMPFEPSPPSSWSESGSILAAGSRASSYSSVWGALWRLLESYGRRLLPIQTPLQALLYGAVWGWLPCGLVYSMLIGSPAQGGAAAGALYMAGFGAGTLPVLLVGGMLAGRLYRLGRDRRFQAVAGLSVILLGLTTLHFQGYNGAP